MENGEVKPLWDMNSQCDNVVKARRPDIIVVSKKDKKMYNCGHSYSWR